MHAEFMVAAAVFLGGYSAIGTISVRVGLVTSRGKDEVLAQVLGWEKKPLGWRVRNEFRGPYA